MVTSPHVEAAHGECSSSIFRELIENLPMVTYVDRPGVGAPTLYVSPQLEEMLGYPGECWLADPYFLFSVLHADDREWMLEARRSRGDDEDSVLTFRVVAKDGRVITVQSERVVVRDEDGVPKHVLGYWVDISERVQFEQELRQAQRLEAVGRLAGGIAHDFNNLLLGIRGYGELALARLERGDVDAASDIRDLLAVVGRAGDLTRQLLAFARRQVLEPEVVDLREVVTEMAKLLCRLLGEKIDLECTLGDSPVYVDVDRSQLEQVLVNLVVNAGDAMPDGGRVAIEVARSSSGEAVLRVTDTGAGMDEDTAAQVFDPFFTTKGLEGTGLGLATAYGVIEQSGGRVVLDTQVGVGSTFAVYLPAAQRAPEISASAVRADDNPAATILLVEDEEIVRTGVTAMLERGGHRVIACADGLAALDAEEGVAAIDLILSDVVMPGLNGPQMVERMRQVFPAAKVLYMSGYTDDVALRTGALAPGTAFIQKPFSGDELLGRVREVLAA
ncbi:MAG: response regulator [Actinobacteria bacterium]|nr:response regulator [Actinomycetota bacterium]